MTIREIEIKTGLTRANVRFYESEGLISPARSANGYLLIVRRNPAFRTAVGGLLVTFMSLLLMLFLEPLFLSCFWTTPGKWLMGLSVAGGDDRRLRYSEAMVRTWSLLRGGLGFGIPIYSHVRQVKCFNNG